MIVVDPNKPAFSPTMDDGATDALRYSERPREGTLARVYTDQQQRAIDRLDAALERAFEMISEAFTRIEALEKDQEQNGMGYRG